MDESYKELPHEDNNNEEIASKDADTNLLIPKSTRWYVYVLFVVSNIFITMDHGSIPASTWNLYKLFNSNQEIGLFGSLVFF